MLPSRLAAASVLACLGIVACPAAPTAEPAAANVEPAPVAALSQPTEPDAAAVDRAGAEPVTLALASAGAEPRRRLQFSAGQPRRQVRLSWQMLSPADMPGLGTLGFEIDVNWTPQPPDRWEFQVDAAVGPEIPGAGPEEQQVLKMIAGTFTLIRGTARLHAASRIELVQTHGVATQPSIPHLLHAFSPVWPDTPIGVGARWTVSAPTNSEGVTGTEVREFELVALDAERATVQVHARTRLDRTGPGEADAGPVMEMASAARLELDLVDPLAQSGEITFSSTMRLPGAAELPPVETDLRVTLASRP